MSPGPSRSAPLPRRRSWSRRFATLVVAASLAGCASSPPIDARQAVVAAERAFARDAMELGIRAAFLAHFAPDGIAFEPGPIRLTEVWSARPPPADPRRITLVWEPAIAGASSSGDLGYTSGPYTLSEPGGRGALAHGVYFSIWRRDDGGAWRVALDAGVVTPTSIATAALQPDPAPARNEAMARDPEEILDADRRLDGPPSTFARSLAVDARWHANGRPPSVGRDAIVAARADDRRELRYAPQRASVSTAGDLGFSYGRYDSVSGNTASQAGHYAHLWRRDSAGWRIVVAVHLE